jgi:hypothetical protein
MKGLDKYLTTEPEDGFGDWAERLGDNFEDKTWDLLGDWYCNARTASLWKNKLYNKGVDFEQAALIIVRAFVLYVQRPNLKKFKEMRARQNYYNNGGDLGSTGHGEECYSDADGGL